MTAAVQISAHKTEALLFYTLLQLGIMMNTRALMELIVINVGYDLGVISSQMFTILVIMAIFSTVITSPLLRRWLPQVGIPVRENSKSPQRAPYQQQG